MELKFSNTTKCTKDLYKEFVNFHTAKYGKKNIIEKILVTLGLIYVLIFNIIYKNIIMMILVIIIYLLYVFYVRKKPKKIITKELKTNKLQKEEDITFNFYDRYFNVIVENTIQKIRYRDLYRVYKDKKNFYLYINDENAFLIRKNSFTLGTAISFNRFIAAKCLLKYRK